LIERQPVGWEDLAITVLDSLTARFLVNESSSRYAPYIPVTLEWFGWPEATYASSMQYARTALRLHQSLAGDVRQNDTWRTNALAMAAACSHGQNNRGDAADGRMFTTVRDLVGHFNVDSWYEQDFNTVIYFLEMMNLEPSLAPDTEIHILDADEALTSIAFSLDGPLIEYATASGGGTERLKMGGAPGYIFAGGAILPELVSLPTGTSGWYWDAATSVVTVYHETGPVVVTNIAAGIPGTDPRFGTVLQLRASGPSIGVDLARDGDLSLAVYDLRGRLVRELVSAESWSAGTRQIVWDGRDNNGRIAASGVYLVRGRSGQAVARTRVVQVR
jgi:hypothetical protein